MADLVKGQTFGGIAPDNECTAQKLNDLVDLATISSGFFLDKGVETAPADPDIFLFWDVSANLYKQITKANLLPAQTAIVASFRKLTIVNNAASPTFKFDVTASELVMRDSSTGAVRRTSGFSRTVDATLYSAGATVDGRDFATLNTDTWYYVWAISDGANDRLLLSDSSTTPTFPSGYSLSCLLGAVYRDAGSLFIRTWQTDNEVACVRQIPKIHTVDFTTVVATVSGTFEQVDLARCCPPSITAKVRGYVSIASNSNPMRLMLATESTGTTGAPTNDVGIINICALSNGAGSTVDGQNLAVPFEIPVKTSQQISCAIVGAISTTMRINGFTLRL